MHLRLRQPHTADFVHGVFSCNFPCFDFYTVLFSPCISIYNSIGIYRHINGNIYQLIFYTYCDILSTDSKMMINEQIAEGMFITKTRISKKTLQFGKDILDSEGMNYEKSLKHHGRISCFEHSINVAEESLKIVGFFSLKVNEKALIRGALLHDYFLYDWRLGGHRLHGFFHARAALANAKKEFRLGSIESDIIVRHMFPLNIRPPRYKESWIVCCADKICAVIEFFSFFGIK